MYGYGRARRRMNHTHELCIAYCVLVVKFTDLFVLAKVFFLPYFSPFLNRNKVKLLAVNWELNVQTTNGKQIFSEQNSIRFFWKQKGYNTNTFFQTGKTLKQLQLSLIKSTFLQVM